MDNKNLRINISFKNDKNDFELYKYWFNKRGRSGYIKNILEREMLKEKSEKESLK